MEKQKRNDRVAYIYLRLNRHKTRNSIHNLISGLGITSNSTAERICKEVESWSKNEKDLFRATYEPVLEDIEKVKEVLKLNKEEIIEKVVDVEIDENEKCKECNTELAGNIAELQKELHTQKRVIDSLQKENIEKDDTIKESKVMIAEICKERDDKQEEIRVLKLEINKYLNDLKVITEDRNNFEIALKELQKENKLKNGQIIEFKGKKYEYVETGVNSSSNCNLCIIDIENEIPCICDNTFSEDEVKGYFKEVKTDDNLQLNPKYDSLWKVLLAAYNQAANGKGKERHQLNDEEDFENQKICEIARRLSTDYNLGQAVKKIYESKRLEGDRSIAELYGAINYIAAAIIVNQEEEDGN